MSSMDAAVKAAAVGFGPQAAALDVVAKVAGLRLAQFDTVGKAAALAVGPRLAMMDAAVKAAAGMAPSWSTLPGLRIDSPGGHDFVVVRRPDAVSIVVAEPAIRPIAWSPQARWIRRQSFAGTWFLVSFGWTWQSVLEHDVLASSASSSGCVPLVIAAAMYKLALWIFDQLFPAA
jgi:hypothetical protein